MDNLPEVPDTTKLTAEKRADMLAGETSLFFNVAKFEHAQRLAQIFAGSTMVPEHFNGNIGNCMIALNLASRFNADPFMVMQNMYVVHGRPGLEGKLIIALANSCGKFTPLHFRFERNSDGKAIACTAHATHKETGQALEQTVTWEMVELEGWNKDKKNRQTGYVQKSKWNTMRDLMFQYRSATFFARVYCPEVLLGMQTTEELVDITDLHQSLDGSYAVETPEKGVEGLIRTNAQEGGDKVQKQKEPPVKEPPPPTSTAPKDEDKDKAETKDAPDHGPWNIENWKNTRPGNPDKGTGFAAHCFEHKDTYPDLPEPLKAEIRDKWERLYPNIPFALEPPKEVPPPEDGPPEDGSPPPIGDNAPEDEGADPTEHAARLAKIRLLNVAYGDVLGAVMEELGVSAIEEQSLDMLQKIEDYCEGMMKH